MKTFEPEKLVAAMLEQIKVQPQWQAWASALSSSSFSSSDHTMIPNLVSPNMFSVPEGISRFLKDYGGTIDPQVMQTLQQDYLQKMSSLWIDMLQSKQPELEDRRFKSPEWRNSPIYAYSAAAYLNNSAYLAALADAVQAPKHAKQKILFTVGQMIDAMSPANFLATNPEAQSKLIASKGESFAKGLVNMLTDMSKGRISQTDENAFEVGSNVATTEGQVVFENDLIQLIQYKPLHATVYQRPLLIVPPCINKFYILDLQPDNSLVRFALDQGNSVFLVSWVNPDQKLAQTTWDNYVESGLIEAIRAVQAISGQEKINTLGFCIGGTLLSTALAVLAARGEQVAASVTLLTTLLDFEDAGALDVFVDEFQVEMREKAIGQGGILPGQDLASVFSSLRPNDLVWNYVQSNYLKGEDPSAFDLLYWNSDATNLPGPMFCWYMRNMYLENKLKQPGKLIVAGEKVDLGQITAPTFIYASREDHIVPWTASYASCSLLNPKKPSQNRFVLGASGHIAGVINPPAKKKRNYWTNTALKKNEKKSAKEWLDGAQSHDGSWWPAWASFLAEHAGKKVRANAKAGNVKYKAIESAPGRYVKV